MARPPGGAGDATRPARCAAVHAMRGEIGRSSTKTRCKIDYLGLISSLFGRNADRARPSWQKFVEQLAWPFGVLDVFLAVKHPRAVDENAVHPNRVADRARTTGGQVVDPPPGGDADCGGIEH